MSIWIWNLRQASTLTLLKFGINKDSDLENLQTNLIKLRIVFAFLGSSVAKIDRSSKEYEKFWKIEAEIQQFLDKMVRDSEDLKTGKSIEAFDFIDSRLLSIRKLLKEFDSMASSYTHRFLL